MLPSSLEDRSNNEQAKCMALNLEEADYAAFQSFVRLCQDQQVLRTSYLQPEDVNDGLTDGATLLRFLQGRSFDPVGALKQFEDALSIRTLANAGTVYETIDVADFEKTRRMYPHWCGRRDKRGSPICVFDLADLDDTTVTEYGEARTSTCGGEMSTSVATQRAIAVHDYLVRFVLPLCSTAQSRPNPEIPVTSAVYLVDISAFTLKQAWRLRNYARDVSQLLATCYPEVIDRVYVLNAPPYFARIWSVLSKWVDPRTASKLMIVSPADVLKTLTSTIGMTNIPSQYGGDFDFRHGSSPKLDDELLSTLSWLPARARNELPGGPIKWTASADGRTAVAVGTTDTKERRVPVLFVNQSRLGEPVVC